MSTVAALPARGSYSVRLDSAPEQVGAARRFMQCVFGDGHPLLDDLRLLVTELVTNAVVHAAGGTVGVFVESTAEQIRVSVRDSGGGRTLPAAGTMQNWESPHGRGLAMVAEMTHDWGWGTDDDGSTVWFVLIPSSCAKR